MTPATSMVALFALSLQLCRCGPPRLNVLSFLRDLGSDKAGDATRISFDPEAGARFREQYERKFGPRGSQLIERLGRGVGTEDAISPLVDIDQILEPSKNKTKHYRTYDFNPPKTNAKKETQYKEGIEIKYDDLTVN